jgi:hypothetical protein
MSHGLGERARPSGKLVREIVRSGLLPDANLLFSCANDAAVDIWERATKGVFAPAGGPSRRRASYSFPITASTCWSGAGDARKMPE